MISFRSRNIRPSSGFSRPAMMRNRVDLPPPEGPINARVWTSSSSRFTRRSTVWFPNDLDRSVALSLISGPFFEPLGPKRDRQSQDQVSDRQGDVALKIAIGERRYLLSVPCKLFDRDN